jgi:hypothetical protein
LLLSFVLRFFVFPSLFIFLSLFRHFIPPNTFPIIVLNSWVSEHPFPPYNRSTKAILLTNSENTISCDTETG